MADPRQSRRRAFAAEPPSVEKGARGLGRWIFFSLLLHGALILALFRMPQLPLRRVSNYPVYSVDLVGGEKLGGLSLGAEPRPAPAPQKVAQKPEPAPRVVAAKEKVKEKRKTKQGEREVAEVIPVKPSKKEARKETAKETPKVAQEEKGLPDEVRGKLIDAALDRVRGRAEADQKKKGEELTSGPGEGEGAAALGPGGRGGGIVKGVEFLIYRNRMLRLIRDRWTWVGKRADLEVTVRFGIQETGEIVGLRLLRASGDPSYDDSVVRAVKRSSPLPPPPESYRKDFMDVELTFRPKDLGG